MRNVKLLQCFQCVLNQHGHRHESTLIRRGFTTRINRSLPATHPAQSQPNLHVINIYHRQYSSLKSEQCNLRKIEKPHFDSSETVETSFNPPVADYNWKYLLAKENLDRIRSNIDKRKGVGNITDLVNYVAEYEARKNLNREECIKALEAVHSQEEDAELRQLKRKILLLASEIPNETHPNTPIGDESAAEQLDLIGTKREFDFEPKSVMHLGTNLKALRTEHVGVTTGNRSYYFLGDFAKLQDALVSYTVDILSNQGFRMVYVPEFIHPSVIEGCGFKTTGVRHQVYHLLPRNGQEMCLAGTGEMPLAGLLMNRTFLKEHLPEKLMTVSKCYRSELSHVDLEKGIYRVHQFTKVEMFGVAGGLEESEALRQHFVEIQRLLFSQLGLHFRILNMPSTELGAPAYCKQDMETWMYDKQFWGEISSTSNCTDFQSRRLGIRYRDEHEDLQFAHTVNGTACAVPRLIMAIAEQYQTRDGKIEIPTVLQPYMKTSVIEQPEKFHKILPLILRNQFHQKLTK